MAAAHNHARRVGGDLQLLAGRRFAKRIQPYGGIVRQLNLHPSRTRSTEMSQNEQVIFGRQLIAITKDVVLSRIGNGKSRSLQELKDQQRQMRDMELERRQNIWRWLIVSVLGLLFMETWLGGWITMRRKTQA